MNWQMVKDIKHNNIHISFVLLALAFGVGLLAPQNKLLFAICVITIVGTLFFSGVISYWGLSLLIIGLGISLGRLYLVFGPNPFNSGRIQQIALLLLLGLLIVRYIEHMKLENAPKSKIPFSVLLGLAIYFILHVFNALINGPIIRDAVNFRGSLEAIFFAPLTFFIAFLAFRNDKNTKRFLLLCFMIGVFQAGLAFLQVLFPIQFDAIVQRISPNSNLIINTYLATNRVYGIWTHAPEFGGLMAVLIPVAIYLTWDTSNLIKRLIYFIGLVILFSALLASASLTPIVTCFMFVLLMIWFRSKEGIFQKIAGVMMLFLVGATVVLLLSGIFQTSVDQLPLINRFTLQSTNGLTVESSLNSRMIIYQAGIRLWLSNFWFGIGVGQFQSFQDSTLNLTAHSVYLQTLAETGFVGMLGFFALIVSQIWLDIKVWKKMNPSERNLHLPIIFFFMIILTVSIFDFTFNKWNFQLLFWFSQGIILGKYNSLQTIGKG